MTKEPGERNPGLRCPNCGCQHFHVVYGRRRGDRYMRVKACRHCGRRITTFERIGG
jgi:transcriptional regulator NrdR family protein